ncbi:L,D-transpeptidase [Microbacterium sp. NPDC058342]|uniref:L,D-transpeptidase n=1 Tax=Microbacterium sp. NPDC058342 TaxID=3346454 RepID=UPI003660BD04
MTDVFSGPDTGTVSTTAPTAVLPPDDGEQAFEWAPTEPAPRKRRLGLWIGLGAGALVLAAAGASMILIAPGTTVAGVAIGGMTPGMAADAISSRLAATEIELTGAGDGVTLSGADLGAAVDATALAEQAFADRPMWNVSTWMGDAIGAEVALDPEAADRALRAAVPASYVDPVDATVAYDKGADKYTTTPAESGTGISIEELAAAFTAASAKGETAFSFPGDATEVVPLITDEKAAAKAEQLNGMLADIGFYVGEERTVPVAADVAATWLSIDAADGELTVTADEAAIREAVGKLPEQVDRKAVDAVTIVDSQGKVLRTEVEGKDGRVLGDTAGVAAAFAEGLAEGRASYELPVTSTPFKTTSTFRRIEVDISAQRVYLFENDKVSRTLATSTGLPGTPTPLGRFRVFGHTPIQDMGCFEGASYCTPDVPWNTWFAPNIAFHGAYWHNNFGQRMSHGCVNLPPSIAKQIYDWSPMGLEVWVHS